LGFFKSFLSNINEFCRVLNQLPTLSSGTNSSSSSSSSSSTGGGGGGSLKRETRNKNVYCDDVSGGAIMTEELRKILSALSKGEEEGAAAKKAISPEALFHVIWKVVPRFR
jgi:hypothetical protein